MIVSKTPLRISFVGGGTDLRSFYSEEPGQVLSVAINKYIYVVIKRQIGIVEYKYRINWSQVEFKNRIEDIEHPIVREALRLMEIDFPVQITTFADIPAGTGLGSSSSFAVGLMQALYALKGQTVTKYTLATTAAQIEIDILKRTMGKQDHFAAALGVETIVLMTDSPLLYGSYSSKMHPIIPDGEKTVTHNTLGKDKINPEKIFNKMKEILKLS